MAVPARSRPPGPAQLDVQRVQGSARPADRHPARRPVTPRGPSSPGLGGPWLDGSSGLMQKRDCAQTARASCKHVRCPLWGRKLKDLAHWKKGGVPGVLGAESPRRAASENGAPRDVRHRPAKAERRVVRELLTAARDTCGALGVLTGPRAVAPRGAGGLSRALPRRRWGSVVPGWPGRHGLPRPRRLWLGAGSAPWPLFSPAAATHLRTGPAPDPSARAGP